MPTARSETGRFFILDIDKVYLISYNNSKLGMILNGTERVI